MTRFSKRSRNSDGAEHYVNVQREMSEIQPLGSSHSTMLGGPWTARCCCGWAYTGSDAGDDVRSVVKAHIDQFLPQPDPAVVALSLRVAQRRIEDLLSP